MGKPDQAVACFDNGFNCSQAVFSAFCEELGLDKDTALKIATSFGGGMGRMGLTCGAVTGAFMVIGLKHGMYIPGDSASKEKTYALVKTFTDTFKALHGSICCRDLLGCDISTPEGGSYAKENGLYHSLCPRFVHDAASIVEDLLGLK